MIGIVIASDLEAAPFLTFQKWDLVSKQPFAVYKTFIGLSMREALLVVSGIGKVAAAVATHLLISKYNVNRIFNPGVCGALKASNEFETGIIFQIDRAVEGDRQAGPEAVLPEKCATDLFRSLPRACLVTCDQPVFSTQLKQSLSVLGELVDMEGAAIARVANMFGLPCVLIKGITDHASEGDRGHLIQNLGGVAQALATSFFNTIGEWVREEVSPDNET